MPDLGPIRRALGGRRARRVAPALLAIAVVAVAIGVIVGGGEPAASNGATTAKKTGSGTATVLRRDLISTDTESGTLGYADPETVFNRVSGTITWLPQVGTIVKPGQRLYAIDGQPVILMDGTTPAFRTIAPGVSDGADVAELKSNMKALGFDSGGAITVNNAYDSALQAAIERWQGSLGETENGKVTLGQVVFLAGPRRIDSISGVLGSTGGGGGSGSGSSASYELPSTPKTEFVSLTTPVATTPSTTTPTTTSPTTTTSTPPPSRPAGNHTAGGTGKGGANGSSLTTNQLLQELVTELRNLASKSSNTASRSGSGSTGSGSGSTGSGSTTPKSSSSGSGSGTGSGSSSGSGSGAGAGATATQIMTTTSSQLVVTVNLDATKQSEATVGEPVTVQLPTGDTTTGKIIGVSTVAQSASSSGSGNSGGNNNSQPSATVPVTIALTGHQHVDGLDQAAVSVNFQQQVERNVLSVPVTALVATAGGGYAVQTTQNGKPVLIPVQPGLFAGGYVEVTGSQLVEGMQVSDSQG